MYDGRHTYDLATFLGSDAKRSTPEQIGKSFAWACGKQAGDYAHTFWSNRRRSERQAAECEPPTRDALARHVERYGPEGVAEVARAHGIDLSAETRRPTISEKRRASALELLDEGKSVEAVARTKSVSAETVRRWVREADPMPKSVQKVRARRPKRRSTMRQKVER